jgi:exoribonuclease-2
MQESRPIANSLVLYKIRPARVLTVADKLEIELEDGKTKRVRDKDVRLLHPGPLHRLSDLTPRHGEVDEAWELLAGGKTTLLELSELIYGVYEPATAWATWQLVAEGLCFEGEPDAIVARTAEQVASDRAQREAKAAAEREWSEFLERLDSKQILPQDRERLLEVERLALQQAKGSRILQLLGHQESPEHAYRMLLGLGYWEPHFNLHPLRLGLPQERPQLPLPPLPDEARKDLTHLSAFAIDDAGSLDPDDAISLDGDRLWVHVADVAALAPADSPLDLEARARGANLYLPEALVPMLPWSLTEQLGLGLATTSPALSIGFRLSSEAEITDVEVVLSQVRVTRLTYADVDALLHESPFDRLGALCRRFHERRYGAGAAHIDMPEVSVRVREGEVVIRPLPRLESREMVTDAMLMAGEAVARYALERDIPIPFATQSPPESVIETTGMAAMYASRRRFKPSRSSSEPAPHASLGLECYSRVTSPLRRYLDLVAHQQLRAHLTGTELLAREAVAQRIGAVEMVTAAVRKAERLSNTHWKLVYLKQHPDWRGRGVVVEMADQRATFIIPELALETRIRLRQEVALDTEIQLAVTEADLVDQMARFRVLAGD